MTDGKAEQALRTAIKEAHMRLRAATDALWLEAFSERRSYEDAEKRIERAAEAFIEKLALPVAGDAA